MPNGDWQQLDQQLAIVESPSGALAAEQIGMYFEVAHRLEATGSAFVWCRFDPDNGQREITSMTSSSRRSAPAPW